jgi:hypothetical protein
VSSHPQRGYLLDSAVNMLLADIAKGHNNGGPWAVESAERLSEAEAVVTYVVGQYPPYYEENATLWFDDRPRVRIHIEVRQT